jgi:RsiW-degrading membrane proteinase PrsW (M82 family)
VDSFKLVILFTMAFIPPIIYAVIIRNTEKFHRERWVPIFLCFLWGATIAIIASLILEMALNFSLVPSIDDSNVLGIITVLLIAPIVEELTKPLALTLKTVKKEINEMEDGLIYGAVAGLGFSATENLFYGYSFLKEGILYFFILISIRILGACLLHASATALTGFGYGKVILLKTNIIRVIPYVLLAIFVHFLYNSLLTFDIIGSLAGLLCALLLSVFTMRVVINKIKKLDTT